MPGSGWKKIHGVAEDLTGQAHNGSSTNSLSSGMSDLGISPDSSMLTDKLGEIESSPHLMESSPSPSARRNPKYKPLEVWRPKKEQVVTSKEGGRSTSHCSTSSVTGGITDNGFPVISSGTKEMLHRDRNQDDECFCKEVGLDCEPSASHFLYDICPERKRSTVVLKAPLHLKNRELRNDNKRKVEGNSIVILRPGMILLKGYLSFNDQVKLITTCRELGIGPGGFYQPEYCDGAKLKLKMMCLGKHWEPRKSSYDDKRPSDGAKAPLIPCEFSELVKRAMKDAYAYLKERHRKQNVEDILPPVSPNICIVNFYTKSSRLGLHQDKDESPESLLKGLPVVSFSVGDSAEFLYGDQRDMFQVEQIVLESGDVLIFGGKARHIYHGVSRLLPDTAPRSLVEETSLRPGRLNLTFREY